MDQHLFLFGGSPPFGRIHGKQFASLCKSKKMDMWRYFV